MQTDLLHRNASHTPLKKRLIATDKILREAYEIGPEMYEQEILDPLSDLIHALLGHRTRYEDNDRAFNALLKRYGPKKNVWHNVRDAKTADVISTIKGVTWPDQKALNIQRVLKKISELRSGDLNLDFLRQMSVADAREWLESLPGVGPKTSGIVLLYSTLKMPALVIDTHHYRVTSRLGLFPPETPVSKAEKYLQALIPPEWGTRDYADHHLALFYHGQQCCYFRSPNCHECPVLKYCPYGQTRLHELTATN
jgi:endonuclease-3